MELRSLPTPALVLEVYRDERVPLGAKLDEPDWIESCVPTPCRDEEAPEMLRRCEERPPLEEMVEMMDDVEG